MDFALTAFTEEQQAAAEAAGAVFSGVAPDTVPSPALTTGAVADDIDPGLWRTLADADLLGLCLVPGYGGSGLAPLALCLVLRESVKVLARVPLLETSAAALALQTYAGPALRQETLPRIGRGEPVLTVATADRTGHEPAELAELAVEGTRKAPTGPCTASTAPYSVPTPTTRCTATTPGPSNWTRTRSGPAPAPAHEEALGDLPAAHPLG